MITETYARVTLRQKRKAVDDVSGSTVNGEDKDAKASLMARIIDKEGAEFGATIGRKSKMMQERNQLNLQAL